NTFTNANFGIELIPAYLSSGGRILNTSIAANSFSSTQTGVLIDPSGDDGQPSTDNTVDGTTIERNVFTGNTGPAIFLDGGIGNGSTVSAIGNAVTNTSIINNLITGDTVYGALLIIGGYTEASGNAVNGVAVVNNTFANCGGCGPGIAMIGVENDGYGGINDT